MSAGCDKSNPYTEAVGQEASWGKERLQTSHGGRIICCTGLIYHTPFTSLFSCPSFVLSTLKPLCKNVSRT